MCCFLLDSCSGGCAQQRGNAILQSDSLDLSRAMLVLLTAIFMRQDVVTLAEGLYFEFGRLPNEGATCWWGKGINRDAMSIG